ncbi:hypothetical protein HYU23_03075 [Candidatus Woesearchaeota archaeon]|nr:hypothetical protein [Candidatus Woesearchaeota archaeon]
MTIRLEPNLELVVLSDNFSELFRRRFDVLFGSLASKTRDFKDYEELSGLLKSLDDGRNAGVTMFTLGKIEIIPLRLPFTVAEARLYYHRNPFAKNKVSIEEYLGSIFIGYHRGLPTIYLGNVKYIE